MDSEGSPDYACMHRVLDLEKQMHPPHNLSSTLTTLLDVFGLGSEEASVCTRLSDEDRQRLFNEELPLLVGHSVDRVSEANRTNMNIAAMTLPLWRMLLQASRMQ